MQGSTTLWEVLSEELMDEVMHTHHRVVRQVRALSGEGKGRGHAVTVRQRLVPHLRGDVQGRGGAGRPEQCTP
jgi:hypothetical protein